MYIIVSPFKNTFDENWLIYFVPDFLVNLIKIGQIIEIPLKNNIEVWVVLKIKTSPQPSPQGEGEDQIIDISKIKSIISIFDEELYLNDNQIKLVFWISNYYITFIHNSLNLFFPKNLKEKIIKKKLKLITKNDFNYDYNNKIKLSEKQEEVLNKIHNSKNNNILFYWLTWSWKTEIYINLIKFYLDKQKQSLLLIPEIILNNQISSRLKKVFWDEIIILNSSITDATKTKNWINIYNNNAKIIIWTRSALFYPYKNLWLIIIDEQHDNSYLSDSQPRYNSIEIAEEITKLNWNKLVLASWTPSISWMYDAINWKYELINLFEKYNSHLNSLPLQGKEEM